MDGVKDMQAMLKRMFLLLAILNCTGCPMVGRVGVQSGEDVYFRWNDGWILECHHKQEWHERGRNGCIRHLSSNFG